MALDVKNIGKVIKTSKREYHWRFDVRNPREADGGSWKLVSIILTDSCVSQKRSLMVNSKKIIDQEKIENFGKTPFSLKGQLDLVPLSIRWLEFGLHDFDLMVSEVSFSELLKRQAK